jgi:hypothetical protein
MFLHVIKATYLEDPQLQDNFKHWGYLVEKTGEQMSHDSEMEDLLKITTSISPVLKELWDNDKDAVYDD